MEDYNDFDEVGRLQKEVDDLKRWKSGTEQRGIQADIARKRTTLNQQIKKTDAELEKAGYTGFSLSIDATTQELQKRVSNDPENAALDRPDGWKRVFKESIYPALEGKFVKRDKGGTQIEMEDEPKDRPEEKETGEGEEWTEQDYIEMRQDQQL